MTLIIDQKKFRNTKEVMRYYQQKVIADLPIEVMIEVEPRCNLDCEFCFNKISFAKNDRTVKPLSKSYLKKVINGIAKSGIKIVRFTGGEPLLRKDLFELMAYAKTRKLEVRLNTNGLLVTKEIASKLNKFVDNILIPMESASDEIEGEITGVKNVLTRKIEAIKILRKAGILIVRIGSVGTKKGIADFEKMTKIIATLPVDEWEWYRPITSKHGQKWITASDMQKLANKIIKFSKKTKIKLSIANAIPFCVHRNMQKMSSICVGAFSDDGHSRLVIDPRGFVKPHYFVEKNIGDPLNILGAWNNVHMKKMRNLKLLPVKCQKCKYKMQCRGGSRHEAMMAYGKYFAADPLMSE